MKNTCTDLNNHLFEQIERLNDEDLTDEQLEKELKRAEGMMQIASKIIENGELQFKAMKLQTEYSSLNMSIPAMFEVKQTPAMIEARS